MFCFSLLSLRLFHSIRLARRSITSIFCIFIYSIDAIFLEQFFYSMINWIDGRVILFYCVMSYVNGRYDVLFIHVIPLYLPNLFDLAFFFSNEIKYPIDKNDLNASRRFYFVFSFVYCWSLAFSSIFFIYSKVPFDF